mgnify:FL=1
MQRILFKNKNECSGCEACANVCPVEIIKMVPDEEGFFYPQIIDDHKCVNCNRCGEVCPIKHVKKVPGFEEHTFAGFVNSDNEIKSCSSGGIASAISYEFIDSKGIVYGVKYDKNCTEVCYERVESIDKINEFKGSKYVQARTHDIYRKVKSDLDAERKVLFIGLPCDCYALKLFLKKEYINLYICTLICHGVSSQSVHKQYCEKIKKLNSGEIQEFSVRHKLEGWKPYYIWAKFADGYEHVEKFADSIYGEAFLYLKRPSCNVCRIKRENIHSDITLGDYHLASGGQVKPYNRYGVSSVIVHTKKGKELIEEREHFCLESVPVKNVLYSEAYYRAIPAKINRKHFGKVFAKKGLARASNLWSVKMLNSYQKIKLILLGNASRIKKQLLESKKS